MAIYEITEDGKVFNLIKGKELKYHIDSNGYVFVNLRTSDGKQTKALVHRLVAEQFVNNPNNYTYVKHKDGNLQNNHYTNLEWMEMANPNLRKQPTNKKVRLIDKKNLTSIEFASLIEASIYLKSSIEICKNIDVFSIRRNIQNVIDKENRTAYGYVWKYV